MSDTVYLEANATIGSEVVDGAHQFQQLMHELVVDDVRLQMLSRLVWATLNDFAEKMPEGVNPIDLLMVADLISGWALEELAAASSIETEAMNKSWVLAMAIRTKLLPAPTRAQTAAAKRRHDKPS